MLFTQNLLPTMLALSLSTTGTKAAIAIGTKANHWNIMWVDGTDPCASTFISYVGESPCNITPHPLQGNGYSYTLQGCGGPLWLNNGDGSYNSNCYDAPADLVCDTHRVWLCG
ncbi:hypothetical protein N5P37_010753 [Trichoderma harzianum]|uniref:Cyanovirin-N domain-containing protein n=2 Tax=Trichoderma TaxID=5543 RepID=A0A2T3ZZG0_TRIHA|nr:hypothetical protein M431DRAFT_152397 [Trichoderma harzianum CBS 226.95]KAK0756599.1 hypothetical protein N5P37_010753 [Trichoderma harzianum]PTB50201.1 hypothetical protein M431DRAFT_152397 [Trichoderma harzianum CBS 226.95]